MIALRSCLTFRIFPESRFIASSPTIYTSLRFRHSRTMASKASLKRAEDFVDFLNASPSGESLDLHDMGEWSGLILL